MRRGKRVCKVGNLQEFKNMLYFLLLLMNKVDWARDLGWYKAMTSFMDSPIVGYCFTE